MCIERRNLRSMNRVLLRDTSDLILPDTQQLVNWNYLEEAGRHPNKAMLVSPARNCMLLLRRFKSQGIFSFDMKELPRYGLRYSPEEYQLLLPHLHQSQLELLCSWLDSSGTFIKQVTLLFSLEPKGE